MEHKVGVKYHSSYMNSTTYPIKYTDAQSNADSTGTVT